MRWSTWLSLSCSCSIRLFVTGLQDIRFLCPSLVDHRPLPCLPRSSPGQIASWLFLQSICWIPWAGHLMQSTSRLTCRGFLLRSPTGTSYLFFPGDKPAHVASCLPSWPHPLCPCSHCCPLPLLPGPGAPPIAAVPQVPRLSHSGCWDCRSSAPASAALTAAQGGQVQAGSSCLGLTATEALGQLHLWEGQRLREVT